MPQAIVDPEEVKRFAAFLQWTAAELADAKSDAASRFRDLRNSWHDEKYDKFEQTFEEALARISNFVLYAQMYAEHLKKRARIADEYLRGRY